MEAIRIYPRVTSEQPADDLPKVHTSSRPEDSLTSVGEVGSETGNGSQERQQAGPTPSASPARKDPLPGDGKGPGQGPLSSAMFSEMAGAQSVAIQRLVEERTHQLLAAYERMEKEMTERRRAEEQLKEYTRQLEAANRCLEQYSFMAQAATRAKSEFLSNVSHEIRTPLNGIIGFAEIILASNSVEQIHLQAQAILQESEHLLALINDVLDDAKTEVGKLELERRPLDIQYLLDSVERTVRVQAEGKGLEFSLQLDPAVPRYVVGDVVRLRQILLNLLGNAVKFTERGSVTLRAEMLGMENNRARLRFWVIDTGIGIPKDKQSLVFQSFTQVCGSTTRRYGGTGLGTSIAQKLVHLMEGEIGFESEPHQGTTFWFTVPLEVCTETPAPDTLAIVPETPPRVPGPASRSARVLVAEDYPINQEITRLHLEGAGHRVVIVTNGMEAVRACQQQQFDLILMDLHMPEMDGYEATREIRKLDAYYATVPILGLTADASHRTVEACREAGLNEVLVKPIRKNAFLGLVSRYLREQGPADSSVSCPPPSLEQSSRAANETPEASHTPPFRYQEAMADFGGNRALLNQALQQFIETVEAQADLVREALERGDRETVRREAHRIRGGAANLTAYPLATIAGRLESLAKEGDLADALRTWDDFQQEFQCLKEYLSSGAFLSGNASFLKRSL